VKTAFVVTLKSNIWESSVLVFEVLMALIIWHHAV